MASEVTVCLFQDADGDPPILDATLESVVEGKARIVKASISLFKPICHFDKPTSVFFRPRCFFVATTWPLSSNPFARISVIRLDIKNDLYLLLSVDLTLVVILGRDLGWSEKAWSYKSGETRDTIVILWLLKPTWTPLRFRNSILRSGQCVSGGIAWSLSLPTWSRYVNKRANVWQQRTNLLPFQGLHVHLLSPAASRFWHRPQS